MASSEFCEACCSSDAASRAAASDGEQRCWGATRSQQRTENSAGLRERTYIAMKRNCAVTLHAHTYQSQIKLMFKKQRNKRWLEHQVQCHSSVVSTVSAMQSETKSLFPLRSRRRKGSACSGLMS